MRTCRVRTCPHLRRPESPAQPSGTARTALGAGRLRGWRGLLAIGCLPEPFAGVRPGRRRAFVPRRPGRSAARKLQKFPPPIARSLRRVPAGAAARAAPAKRHPWAACSRDARAVHSPRLALWYASPSRSPDDCEGMDTVATALNPCAASSSGTPSLPGTPIRIRPPVHFPCFTGFPAIRIRPPLISGGRIRIAGNALFCGRWTSGRIRTPCFGEVRLPVRFQVRTEVRLRLPSIREQAIARLDSERLEQARQPARRERLPELPFAPRTAFELRQPVEGRATRDRFRTAFLLEDGAQIGEQHFPRTGFLVGGARRDVLARSPCPPITARPIGAGRVPDGEQRFPGDVRGHAARTGTTPRTAS